MSWVFYQEQWSLLHGVNFDGGNKTITVSSGISFLDIKKLYSWWKEWVQLYDYAKYPPAFRTTGGDPVGAGNFTGDVYFLVNNWKLCYDPRLVEVSGVLYSDDYDTAFWDYDTITPIYPTKVSSIVNTVSSGVGSVIEVRDAVWSAVNLDSYGTGSAGEKLESVGAASNPWLTNLSTYNTPGTAGKVLKDALSETLLVKGQTDSVEPSLTAIANSISSLPNAVSIANEVRTELTPELAKIMTLESNPGLTVNQANMLLEMYELLGLDPTKPLVVTENSRVAGAISQTIVTSETETMIMRN